MTLTLLSCIQGASRRGLNKYYKKGFYNIFQNQIEVKNTQNRLKQVSVSLDQSLRTICTQIKLAQQNQPAKDDNSSSSIPSFKNISQSPDFATDELTKRQKLQKAVKEYGSTVMIFHVTISLVSLGAFYLAVSSGIDMVAVMSYIGVGDKLQQSQIAAGTSSFVVAYAIHKVFAPARIGITLSVTPLLVKYLRQKGILKPNIPRKKLS